MSQTWLAVASAILIPVFAYVLNWKMREARGYQLSAAADFVLALMAFDLGALASPEAFKAAMPHSPFLQSFEPLFVCLFCVGLFFWSVALLPLENAMATKFDASSRIYIDGIAKLYFMVSWTIAAMLLAAHCLLFFLRVTS
jgi:hypothetical protein